MLKRPDVVRQEAQLSVPSRIEYPQPGFEGTHSLWGRAIGLYLLASLVLIWPWISGAVSIPWDAKAHFYPQASFLAQAIHNGENPFWNPYVFGGHPQIADPQSLIFSPPFLLLAFLTPNPSFQMVDFTGYATLIIGGLGFFGFARDRRWHPAAAMVAALAFAFGSSAAWRNQHVGQIVSLAYFPWALWMLERGLRLHSARYGALSGLFAGLSVWGPDQVAYLILVTLAGFTIGHWLGGDGRWQRVRGSLRPLLAGAVVGGGMIVIPMLMVLSFADGSNRSHISLQDAYLGSLHPSSLITFVVSNIFGTIGPADDFWGAPSTHWPYIVETWVSRNMANFYMGILPVIGMSVWLIKRRAYSGGMTALVLLFGVMVAYALGRYTPLFSAFYHFVPGADLFRRPADSTFLVGAIGAILAGGGVNVLLQRGESGFTLRSKRVLAIVMAVPVLVGFGMAIWLNKVSQALPDIAIALLTIALSFAALLFAIRHARSKPMRATVVLALCLAADLGWNIRPNHSTAFPPETFAVLERDKPNETMTFLKANVVANETRRDRIELAGLGFEAPNASMIHRLENTLGYNPLRISHYGTAVGARDHIPWWDSRKFSAMMPGYRSPFANLLGLRYIASPVPIDILDPNQMGNAMPLVARTKEAYIYENIDTLPRVMVVPEAVITDQNELVRTGNWPSTDFRKTVFIERTSLPLPRTRVGGTAKITEYTNTRITIETDAAKGGVLLLNDIWHPWWFAEIDGKTTPVLRANGSFRAVILPAGVKTVTFTFEPLRGMIRRYLVAVGVLAK